MTESHLVEIIHELFLFFGFVGVLGISRDGEDQ